MLCLFIACVLKLDSYLAIHVKSVASLREAVESEISNATRARGGHSIGRRELPKDKRAKRS